MSDPSPPRRRHSIQSESEPRRTSAQSRRPRARWYERAQIDEARGLDSPWELRIAIHLQRAHHLVIERR